MQKNISLSLLPHEANDEQAIRSWLARSQSVAESSINGFHILKQSIDARSKRPVVNLLLQTFINEPVTPRALQDFAFRNITRSVRSVLIVGAGPAGLFAALKLIELGYKPIIIERGKEVRARRRDLAQLNKEGIVNPESNYCFGEGGAGTYSDGKLYTRSSKRGDVQRILQLFHRFGADENILFQAHPHIGTNKLPGIITAMRNFIIECGGEIHFEKKLVDVTIDKDRITSIITHEGDKLKADAYILATGHSARDIFNVLHQRKIGIASKPFALGVRVEHPQSLIDSLQYHASPRDINLPPAAYSWVQQVDGRGVFSFCMCPGGIIAPAATSPGELVVNGWSPSKRNNPFANSGIVVTVDDHDAVSYFRKEKKKVEQDALLLMKFQSDIEQKAFHAGGGLFKAPATRLADFCAGRISPTIPENSYLPGTTSADMNEVLPAFIKETLQRAFIATGKKMKGYLSNDAIIVATESRTSSPVRIPRDPVTLCHPQCNNLYPCGEGAGYAGGIVSAAMDGERIADAIGKTLA